MAKILLLIFKSARPRQGLKNLAILAPLVFSGKLFSGKEFGLGILALLLFSFLTSAIYLFNDIIDIPKDRIHPYKKLRPIASGQLPIEQALAAMGILVFLALFFAYRINLFFFLVILAYFVLQIIYTLVLKNIAILDVISIATGFILRVYAGAIMIDVHMSVWFLLCVVSLALFLAVGKRRAELAVLEKMANRHRKVFIHYPPELLNHYLAMFSTSAWISYALFAFFQPAPLITHRFPFLIPVLIRLPLTLAGTNKWLMLTLPLVIFGIMRYSKIIFEGKKAESPERVILADKPLLICATLWTTVTVLVIYGLN